MALEGAGQIDSRVHAALQGTHFVAGSYERLLYGLELSKNNNNNDSTNEKSDSRLSKKQRMFQDATRAAALAAVREAAKEAESSLALEPSYVYPAHISCIKTLAANNRFLVSGSTDELVKIYDLKLRKEVGVLMHHTGTVTSLKFFGRYNLITASEDGNISVLRIKDWEVLKTLDGHKHGVNAIDIHPSGKMLLSAGRDRTLKLWDLTSGSCAYQMRLPGPATKVLWSPKTDTLAGGEFYAVLADKRLTIHTIGETDVLGTIAVEGLAERFNCMAFINLKSHAANYQSGFYDNKGNCDKKWVESTEKSIEEALKHASEVLQGVQNSEDLDETKKTRAVQVIESRIETLLSTSTLVKSGLVDGFLDGEKDTPYSEFVLAVGYESGKVGLYSLKGKLLISLFESSIKKQSRVKDMDSYIALSPKEKDPLIKADPSTKTTQGKTNGKKRAVEEESNEDNEDKQKELNTKPNQNGTTNILTTCESDGHLRVFLGPELPRKLVDGYVNFVKTGDATTLGSKFAFPKVKADLVYDAKCRLTCIKIAPGLAKIEKE